MVGVLASGLFSIVVDEITPAVVIAAKKLSYLSNIF